MHSSSHVPVASIALLDTTASTISWTEPADPALVAHYVAWQILAWAVALICSESHLVTCVHCLQET